MLLDFGFFLTSILLGVALAVDAFSVSCADAFAEPDMSKSKGIAIALTFGIFQFAMPVIGWVCVHTIAERFEAFQKFIPWIGFILLLYIGGKMLIEGLKKKNEENPEVKRLGFGLLMVQGIATAIDALSVGFTTASYNFTAALISSLIIALVTFVICIFGIFLGKKIGNALSNYASIFGGVILILIGIKILLG